MAKEMMSKEAKENIILILNLVNLFMLWPMMMTLSGNLAVLWFLLVCSVAGLSATIEFVILERK